MRLTTIDNPNAHRLHPWHEFRDNLRRRRPGRRRKKYDAGMIPRRNVDSNLRVLPNVLRDKAKQCPILLNIYRDI